MGYKRVYGRGGVATQTTDITVFAETSDSGVVGAGTYKTVTLTPDTLKKLGEISFFVVYFHARSVGNVDIRLNGVTVQTVNIPSTAAGFPSARNAVFVPYTEKGQTQTITAVHDANQIYEGFQVDARTTVVV